MLLDASGFHAGSFAPALSGRKVHPVYRLHYIRTTTTLTGLKVRARLLRKKYEKGEKISAQKMKHLALSRHKTQPKWNYTLRPM